MQLKPEQERVSSLLKETITLMCKNGLKFETKFTIDAVIGVTLDEKEVFLISVNEIFNTEKSAINDDNSSNASDAEMGSISHRKKRKRNRCIKKESGSDGESGQEQDEEKADEHSDALNLDSNDDNSIMFIKEEPQTSSWQTSSCSFQDQNVGGQSELKFSSYPGADTSHDATDLNFGDPSFPSGINQSLIGRSGARQQGASTYLTASGNKHAVMPQLGDQTFMSQTGGNQTQGPNQVSQFRISPASIAAHADTKVRSGLDECPPLLVSLPTSHKNAAPTKPRQNRRCELCGKSFTSQYGYQVHLKRHQGIHPYTCEVCGKGMSSKTNYDEHMRHHTGDLLHCGNCSRSFITHRSYRSHMLSCK